MFENEATGFFKLPRGPPGPARVEDMVPKFERGRSSPRACSNRRLGPPPAFPIRWVWLRTEDWLPYTFPDALLVSGPHLEEPLLSRYTGVCEGPIPTSRWRWELDSLSQALVRPGLLWKCGPRLDRQPELAQGPHLLPWLLRTFMYLTL